MLKALDKCYLSLTWTVYYQDNGKYFYLLLPHAGNYINDSHMLWRPRLFSLCFYSSSQLSRYLLSLVQFTTLSAPCVIKHKHSWTYYCHTCQKIFFLRLLYDLVIHLSKYDGWCTVLPLVFILHSAPCPFTSAETFNSAAFSALLDKKTPPFQVPIFQMPSVKDSFARLLSTNRATGVLHLKRPQHITASEVQELHHKWDFGVKFYHPLN